MSSPAEPDRQEPVFRLVADTTTFSQATRFRLAKRVGLLDQFVIPPPDQWSEN